MRITLIRPPAYSEGLMGAQLVPYLGIAYVAAKVRNEGFEVDIVDMCGEDIERTEIVKQKFVAYGMAFSALKNRLKESHVFAFTCMFSQDWPFHRDLIKFIRDLFPESFLVAGGEHITSVPEYCLNDCPELDACVVGEGEITFLNLVKQIELKGDLSEIKGIAYRKDDKPYVTGKPERMKNIDDLPLPAWDLTPIENYLSRGLTYHIKRGRTIPMLATRGCPYKCSFCSNVNMWGLPWVPRDPKLVVDEIELYMKKYKANNFVFSDLTAVVKRETIVNFCKEIIDRNLEITWQLPTLRTEAVDINVLKLMYKAGCRELDFAIESGAKKVLAGVGKKNNPQKMASLIKDSLKSGMNMSINIVIGLPDEGLKEFFESYYMVLKLAVCGLQEVNAFPFIPYPGSRLFYEFVENKKVVLSDEYFLSLFGYADLAKPISWSEKFGPGTLCLMRLFLLMSFYAVMLITHPKRIISLISNLFHGRITTKLEGVLHRVIKNVRVYFRKKKCVKK